MKMKNNLMQSQPIKHRYPFLSQMINILALQSYPSQLYSFIPSRQLCLLSSAPNPQPPGSFVLFLSTFYIFCFINNINIKGNMLQMFKICNVNPVLHRCSLASNRNGATFVMFAIVTKDNLKLLLKIVLDCDLTFFSSILIE